MLTLKAVYPGTQVPGFFIAGTRRGTLGKQKGRAGGLPSDRFPARRQMPPLITVLSTFSASATVRAAWRDRNGPNCTV
ncbi:hypothetical protein NH8B_0134 [Pseudogulbenkiania sp. NH8B]|nr:hypothetical protein NH8B_0134 [Pseudogulbenkiania sp. NH8B]